MDIELNRRFFKSSRAFTLIELLVVVTIIGILAGLAMPMLSSALDNAKKAQAKVMMQQLRTALNNYQLDYGTWPNVLGGNNTSADTAPVQTDTSSGGTLYQVLIGNQTADNASNPRGTVYMEFKLKDLYPSGTTTSSAATGFVDPWSGPYFIVVDGNYDNTISVPNLSTLSGNTTINAAIGIWSHGKSGNGTATTPTKNWIGSW